MLADNQYVSLKGKVVSMFPIQEVSIKSYGKKIEKMNTRTFGRSHSCVLDVQCGRSKSK